jgi:hypothetical protein
VTEVVRGACPTCGAETGPAGALCYTYQPTTDDSGDRVNVCVCGSWARPVVSNAPYPRDWLDPLVDRHGYRLKFDLLARREIPRTTSLIFTRRRDRWTVHYLADGRHVEHHFWTKWGCRRFAASLGRNAAFFS